LQQDPFGEIGRPDGDVFARLEASQQGVGNCLGLFEQLAKAQACTRLDIGLTRDQGHAVGIELGGLPQHAPDRRLEDGL